ESEEKRKRLSRLPCPWRDSFLMMVVAPPRTPDSTPERSARSSLLSLLAPGVTTYSIAPVRRPIAGRLARQQRPLHRALIGQADIPAHMAGPFLRIDRRQALGSEPRKPGTEPFAPGCPRISQRPRRNDFKAAYHGIRSRPAGHCKTRSA